MDMLKPSLRVQPVHGSLPDAAGRYVLYWMIAARRCRWNFALDHSGIFWVLGRYDRPWPERPVFGTVRYMTSASTARKLRLKRYLRRYGSASSLR